MANKIGLIVKYSTEGFDEVYRAESRSSLLDGNKKLMQFTGVKTVKVAKFTSGGLFDYARANGAVAGNFAGANRGTSDTAGYGYGYQQSDMGVEWEEFTISCDRAAQYRVELFDNEETAQMAVGQGTTQINKQVVIPEVDAFTFSKIASYASEDLGNLDKTSIVLTSTAGSDTPVEALNKALLWFDGEEVPPEDQIIFCSPRFLQSLRNTAANGIVKPLMQNDFNKDVKFTIEEYEGRQIVMVPPRRFMTNVLLYNGGYRGATATDIGLTSGGYEITAASEAIDFMVVAKSAVYHIVKYNKIKVFGPEVVQDYDGYKVNARIYHDVFIPDNKRVAIYVHTNGFTDALKPVGKVYGAALAEGTTTGQAKLASVGGVLPGTLMDDGVYYISKTAMNIGAAVTSGTTVAMKVGDIKEIKTALSVDTGDTAYIHAAHNGVVTAVGTVDVIVK